ncbi:MAG: hypothetical protein CL421_00615, partial [Acidimicrobiaceae bacterium]|nr:hypothetical protein [Acidimicrobiaceae bacterium]
MLKKLSLKNRNKKPYARPRKRALLAATALLASVVPVIATASPAAAVGEGITLSKTTATVTEAGGADTFTVVLDAQPSSNVVLQVVSADTGEATVSPSTLTFTNGNWDTPQTVTLTGANDSIIDGNVNSTITISVVDLLSDDNYDSIGDVTVTATTTDNEVAGFTKSQTARTVTEAGGTSTFTLVLDAQPDSNVVLNVVSADTGEVTVGTANYTFTSGNWDTAQTVTLTGVNDDLVDGSINTSVTISVVDESSDNNFDSVSDETVTVTTTDGDTAGFTIVETGSETSVTESGTSDTFTIVLDAAPPSSSVVLAISSGDTGEATVNPATLTFSTGNWNSAQTVTVTGVDDDIVDGSVNTAITISVNDASSDDSYDSLGNSTVTAATADNDNAGFTVAESSGSTAVTEAGGTDSFTVVLDK